VGENGPLVGRVGTDIYVCKEHALITPIEWGNLLLSKNTSTVTYNLLYFCQYKMHITLFSSARSYKGNSDGNMKETFTNRDFMYTNTLCRLLLKMDLIWAHSARLRQSYAFCQKKEFD